MPLIPLRPLLETVDKYHFAQGAFNVNAVAQAKAAIEVHEMFRSAAILQGADLANGFMGGRTTGIGEFSAYFLTASAIFFAPIFLSSRVAFWKSVLPPINIILLRVHLM